MATLRRWDGWLLCLTTNIFFVLVTLMANEISVDDSTSTQLSTGTVFHLGRCPKYSSNSTSCQSSVSDECITDTDCAGKLMCCFNGCSRNCIQPVYTACEHQRISSEKRSRALSLALNDSSVKILKCRPDGRFEPIQCDEDNGQCWCVDEAGFELGGTRANSKNSVNCTSPRPCAGHLCRMLCPFDFELDDDGCPLCRCRDPCQGVRCPGGTQCQLEEVQCVHDPCPPVPTCKRPRSLDDACPVGKALTMSESNKLFLCGQDPSHPQCPTYFNCEIQPSMEYGVCCPAADKLMKPGTCPNSTSSFEECGIRCQHDMECEGLQKCCSSEQCGSVCTTMVENTPCLQQKILAELLSINEKSGQGYIPQCTPSGQFQPTQCSRNGKVCWCVDMNGFKVPRSMGSADVVDCALHDGIGDADVDTCDNSLCVRSCPYGYKLDGNGCQTCDCADLCESIKCPTDMECVIVENEFCLAEPCENYPICKPQPILYTKPGDCPPSKSVLNCSNVTCTNDHDCEGTKKCCLTSCGRACVEHAKPSQRLPTMCEYLRDFGRKAIDNTKASALALPDLSCKSDGTYQTVQCREGYCWCVDEFGTEIVGSQVSNTSKDKMDCDVMKRKKGCDGLLCRLGCDYGFEYGEDGCPICKCRDPCNSTHCLAKQQCHMVEVDCRGGFCPAVPRCIEVRSVPVACPIGPPLQHPGTNISRSCGPSSLCPDSYFCHLEKEHDVPDGICCKKLVKPGQCPYRFEPKFGHCEGTSECESDHQCPDVQKCCSDGCQSTCTEPELKTACEHHAAVAHYMTKESSVLLGDVHLPKCNDEDGSFSEIQCNSLGRSCWCVDEAGREVPSTRTKFGQQPKCREPTKSCAELRNCNLTCPSGYKLDDKGCGSCTCRDPCEELLCSKRHEECRMIKLNCITEPCPPVPMCVPRINNPCPYGEPILNRHCSSLPDGSSCPSTHVCLQSPLEDFPSVCCPKPRDVCFQYPQIKDCPENNDTYWVFNLNKNNCESASVGSCPTTTNRFISLLECKTTCPALSECERSRQKALRLSKKKGGFGFVPKCRADGTWEAMQCLPEVGLCWCVNSMGDYMKGTAVRGTPRCASSRMGRKLDILNLDEPIHGISSNNGLVCDNGEPVHLCNASRCENKVCLNNPNAVCRINPCGGCHYKFFVENREVNCEEGLTVCQKNVQKILNSELWSLQTLDYFGVILGSQAGFEDNEWRELSNSQLSPDQSIADEKNENGSLDPLVKTTDWNSLEVTAKLVKDEHEPYPLVEALSMVIMPPRCSMDGAYQSVQRQGELSWCVDQLGNPVHETLTRGLLKCSLNGTVLERKSRGPVCADKSVKPRVCTDSCLKSRCHSRPDAICLADPCNDCRATFVSRSGEVVQCDDKCHQPLEVGMCRAAFPRWFHNATSGKCESFIYGGCLGSDNNFESKQGCEDECLKPVDVCDLPKRIGMCRAAMKQWWYNKHTQQCEQFIYGGCDGNANNFDSKEHCQATCPRTVLCPRLDIVKSMEPCDRSSLCRNRTCATEPDAICTVDPCDCSISFIDYSGQKVNSCDSEMGVDAKTQPDATEEYFGSTLSDVTTVESSITVSSSSPQHSTVGLNIAPSTNLPLRTLCQRKRQRAILKRLHYVPQCDSGVGHFLPMQCDDDKVPATKGLKDSHVVPRCWCVDESGNRIRSVPIFQKGSRECKTAKVESVEVNLVFVHDDARTLAQKLTQIKKEIVAMLNRNNVKSGVVEEDIEVGISPQTLELRFILKGNEKIEVAGLLQEKMESGITFLPLEGLHLKLDSQASIVEHHLAGTSVQGGSETQNFVLSETTIILVAMFGCVAILLAVAVLALVLIRRKRSQGYYPHSGSSSVSSVDSKYLGIDTSSIKSSSSVPWTPEVDHKNGTLTSSPAVVPGVSLVENDYETLMYHCQEGKGNLKFYTTNCSHPSM